MSKVTKRKHVQQEALDLDWEPPKDDQSIVKILMSRGNNLHEVEDKEGSTYLVSMPVKFRKNIWIKRGDYVIIEPISEGDRVKAEIIRVLTPVHVKEFKKIGVWPWPEENSEEAVEGEEDEDGLIPNTNRRQVVVESEDETSDSDENESADDEQTNP